MPYHGWPNKKVTEQVSNGYRLPKPAVCPENVYEIMIKCWNKNPKVAYIAGLKLTRLETHYVPEDQSGTCQLLEGSCAGEFKPPI